MYYIQVLIDLNIERDEKYIKKIAFNFCNIDFC